MASSHERSISARWQFALSTFCIVEVLAFGLVGAERFELLLKVLKQRTQDKRARVCLLSDVRLFSTLLTMVQNILYSPVFVIKLYNWSSLIDLLSRSSLYNGTFTFGVVKRGGGHFDIAFNVPFGALRNANRMLSVTWVFGSYNVKRIFCACSFSRHAELILVLRRGNTANSS